MRRTDSVAVFLDFENLVLGAERALPDAGQRAVPYKALDAFCRERGSATVRRAYADWARPDFGKYQEDLALNGVDLIQVTRFGLAQKNAADIRMAVDAMETLITHPEISVYVLVAGDGDYSPLVQRLREFGKTVIGIGTEASASPRLVAVCSEYTFWGTLVAEVDPTVRQAVTAEFDIAVAVGLVLRTLDVADASDRDGWVHAAELKSRMLVADPSFDNKNYAAKTFSSFLARPEVAAHVQTSRNNLVVSARRRQPEPTTKEQNGRALRGSASLSARAAPPASPRAAPAVRS